MESEVLIYIGLSLAMGAVVTWALCKSHSANLTAQLAEARALLSERTASREREKEQAQQSALNVLMYPYKEEHGEDGYFTDERRAEIGYKFQLFVAGVPCLEPHKVALEVLSKKQVNAEHVEKAMQSALAVIEGLASQHPAFRAAKSAAALEAIRLSLAKSGAQHGTQPNVPAAGRSAG